MASAATELTQWQKEELAARNMQIFEFIANNNISSLHWFCRKSRKVLTQPFDIEIVDEKGNTPLLCACYLGKAKCALILIKFGANLKAINYLGQNALTQASYFGNLYLVQKLLTFRTYEDFNLSSMVPALCVATLKRHTHLVEYFKSIDPTQGKDIKTVHGLTADDLSKMITAYQKTVDINDFLF